VPAGQSVQDGSPANEYCPALHAVQEVLDVLPETDVVPAEQVPQTFALANVFEGAPARAYLPAGQVKDKHAPPLPVEYVPAAQIEQSVD